MKKIRLSKTFADQLAAYIDAGEQSFGIKVAQDKRRKVVETIKRLAMNPRMKRRHPDLGLVIYPVAQTPFFIIYDYDAVELRILFVFISGKPLSDIDPAGAEW